jgi:hypothetical protein
MMPHAHAAGGETVGVVGGQVFDRDVIRIEGIFIYVLGIFTECLREIDIGKRVFSKQAGIL